MGNCIAYLLFLPKAVRVFFAENALLMRDKKILEYKIYKYNTRTLSLLFNKGEWLNRPFMGCIRSSSED